VRDIEIKNVNSWVMEAIVAQSYINKYDDPYAFLVGDAAHAFPPSGGFGMNTGIGDSFNLAHKIA
jgi:2-polyprenyl-6-methoxyphenol hydroxylase-like FAD-dependent oxidoreductase